MIDALSPSVTRLGLDIGRVLVAPSPAGSDRDTSFFGSRIEDVVRTPPYAGMFDAVPTLVERFESRVWLISKAGARVQDKTRRWLAHHRFFERTGIDPSHLRFCLERHEKADHARELGLTHFVDDRADVLAHLQGIVPHRYLFGPQDIAVREGSVMRIPNWADALLRIVR